MLEMKGALMNACLEWFASKKVGKAPREPGSLSTANEKESGYSSLCLTAQHRGLSKPMGRFWLA